MSRTVRKFFPAIITVLTIMVLAVVTGPFPAQARIESSLESLEQAFVSIARTVTPAVVNIQVTRKAVMPTGTDTGPDFSDPQFREFFNDDLLKRFFKGPRSEEGFKSAAMGSGVIISPDGHILTNAHVVANADTIKVILSDKRTFDAKLIGADKAGDVAVVKIDATGLPTGKMGDSDAIQVGQIVGAVGNPFGLSRTFTTGIVSATGRTNVGIVDYEDFIQTDAAINPGNSGGPLVNTKGEIIGINTAIASRSGGYQGIGFAIPSNSAKLIMTDLIKDGQVRRGLLGVNIQDLNESLAKSFHRKTMRGALVSQVVEGSAAEKAGIKSGDVITEINGKPVEDAAHLKNLVAAHKPHTTVSFKLFRDGKPMELSATIGDQRVAKDTSAQPEETHSKASNELGIVVEKVPAALAKKLGLQSEQGLRVADVNSESLGGSMGLRSGDVILEVNGNAVSDLSSFQKGLTLAKKTKTVTLKIQRGDSRIYLGAPIA
ncbi:MAG: DegQ family serine endoprotease [Pseudomonadota bacterium]